MIVENIFIVATRRITVFIVLLLSTLAVMAEDVTFMTNRRQWERLPTATLLQLGDNFLNNKNLPDSAMLCYTIAANRYNENLDENELKQCVLGYYSLALLYGNHYNNYYEGWKYILKTQQLANKHSLKSIQPLVLMQLGVLSRQEYIWKNDIQYYKKSLAYYKSAFKQSIDNEYWRYLQGIIYNLIALTFGQDDLASSINELRQYNQMSIPDTVLMRPYTKELCQGMILYYNHKPEKALEIFLRLAEGNDYGDSGGNYNYRNMQLLAYNAAFSMLLQLGRYDEAKSSIEKARQLVPIGANEQYMLLYEHMNNQTLAKEYQLLWYKERDSLYQAFQVGDIENVRFLHELDKMNEEQKALTLKQQHDRKMLWVVSGFLALALGLIVLLVINRGLIKQKNKVLYENNVALLAAEDERRRQAEQEELARVEAEAAKYGAIRMDEQSTEELWQNIIHVMGYSQEIFDENFSVARLAELIEAKSNYVSQAINQHDNKGFPNLLAHYRIQEVCRRMNDSVNYKNYTVEGFGQSVGYTSRSHFVKLFKHHTGLTPSDYMKQCRASTSPALLESLSPVN